ncbi:MAG: tRNA (adenosine(37)-N6)-threonylcarbamoyltransferase complex dimerization subunit type 1 TsaB [Leptospirillia bacterium]
MIHLSVETSTEWVDLALLNETSPLSCFRVFRPGGASEVLVPALETVLVSAGVSPESLAFLSSSRGPGTYTSIRVGHLFVRGLTFSLKVPHVTISPFDVLARQCVTLLPDRPDHLVVLLDARRGEVNAALYRLSGDGDPVRIPSSASGEIFSGRAASPRKVLEQLPPGKVALVGPGIIHLGTHSPPAETRIVPPLLLHPSACVMGALAFAAKMSGEDLNLSSDLLYGRDSVCS